MGLEETTERLTAWFGAQLGDATGVRITGLDRMPMGHSAETLALTLGWRDADGQHGRDVVLRIRPPFPGLLEPYDLRRQYDILRALESTAVRAPGVLWHEGTTEVIGREFYVMERLGGTVYEQGFPDDLRDSPERLLRMSTGIVEQIAAIHRVDLTAVGLDFLGDGGAFLDREMRWWESEMRRVQQGPVPALERLLSWLGAHQPEQSPNVTLVHGDPKPGNFAFEGDDVSAVFDWELTSVGDPLADIGWLLFNWTVPGSFTSASGALTAEEVVELYQDLTGIPVRHRDWYVAFQSFKLLVILLVGSMLFDGGQSEDLRLAHFGMAIPQYTAKALARIGVHEKIDDGPVAPREERLREVTGRTTNAAP
jgi:aminoglycoside phosphotransferase (APT) family kinase protein